jgi:hypothetical protein
MMRAASLASPSVVKPLTTKQISFCKYYVSNGFNAKQAALKAGYSESVSHTGKAILMSNPLVRETIDKAIAKVQESALDKVGASFVNRCKRLWRVVDDTIPEVGEIRHAYVRNAIAAIAELNKMGGDYAPDKSLRLTVDMTKEKMKEVEKVYNDF